MTSEKVALNGGLVMFSKGIPPQNPLHSAIGIIVLCPDCMVISWIRWILKMLILMMRHLRLTTFSCAVCSSICGLMSILFYLDFLVEVVKPPVLVTTSKLWAINSLAMVHGSSISTLTGSPKKTSAGVSSIARPQQIRRRIYHRWWLVFSTVGSPGGFRRWLRKAVEEPVENKALSQMRRLSWQLVSFMLHPRED